MKIPVSTLLGAIFVTFLLELPGKDGDKVTFEDHILPIFENKCLNCHNPDEAKGGLDLSTYGAMLNGGSGGKVVEPEDLNGSRVYSLMAHAEEPYMPPRKPKAPDAELALMAKWINGGILETSSSKARKSDKPKMDMSLITSTGKPEGPAAMPEHVILQPEVVTNRPTTVPALAHSPWAPIIAVAGQKQVILYHSEDYDVLGILPYPEGFPQSLSFSSSGALLQAGGGRGGKSGGVVAWDVKTGERVIEVGREFDIVLGSDISPDHRRVVMGGPGKIFKIWDTVSGEQVAAIKKHPDWMLTADYSPDGVLLATGGRNSGLYIWEGATGLEFYTLKGHTKAVTNLAWRPDSNILASISEDGQAILWEMNEGKQIKKWPAHSGGGLFIDFSPDGQMIATAGRDKTVKLWKADGAGLRTINASDDIVMSVVFTHDSKRVISGDYNGVIKVWNVADGKQLAVLNANPPTIDKQLAYAENQITELNSKLPELEKKIAAAKAEADKARAALNEISKKEGDLGGRKGAMAKEVAALDANLKALTDQKAMAQGLVTQNTSLMQQRAAERVKAEKEMQATKAESDKWKSAVGKYNQLFVQAKASLDSTTNVTRSPAFADPNKEKAYRAAKAAHHSALTAKRASDANAAAKQKAVNDIQSNLNAQQKNLAGLSTAQNQAKAARDQAQNLINIAIEKRKKADAALAEAAKNGQPAPPEQAKAQQEAIKELANAQNTFKSASDTFSKAYGQFKAHEGAVAQIAASLKGPTDQLTVAQNDQKNKTVAFQKAGQTLAPFLSEGAAKINLITKAESELPAKTAAFKKAEADLKHHQNLANQSATKLAQSDAKLKSALAAENSARGDMEEANTTLMTKAKALSETGSKLNTTKAELNKVAQALEATKKQKEAQAKTVTTVASKENEVKKSFEVVKADLEQSHFLARKFKAAALNFEAKVESEALDNLATELGDMLEDETEAKNEHKVATEARVAAEKTLAEAQKTVVDGTQKLKDTTSTVLDTALALIASRAAAELREEIATEVEKPIEVAAVEDPGSDVNSPLLLIKAVYKKVMEAGSGEMIDEVEVVDVVSTTLADKTTDEINSEIAAIQKRLANLSVSIKNAYFEASKTKSTVNQASDVAAKTPPVIAQRTKVEQTKAEKAREIETMRKAQEVSVAQKKNIIADLKKKYLETVPERK